MRNTLIGGVLAVVLVAGLFAAAWWGRHAAVGAGTAASPEHVASALPADFVGETKIGDWHFVCGKPKAFPASPRDSGHPEGGNSEGTEPRNAPPPPGFMFPRCHVVLARKTSAGEILVSFRQFGFKRVLTLFVRLPPGAVQSGDSVTARFDRTQRTIAMRCAMNLCLGVDQFRKAEQPIVLRTGAMTVLFRPSGANRPVEVDMPTAGLAAAIAAMQRINK